LRDIYDFKWSKGKYFSDEQIIELERKESKIVKELMRRKYLTKSDSGDFQKHLNSMNFRKKTF